MNESNHHAGSARSWIAIIVSIVIAFTGITIGIVTGISRTEKEQIKVNTIRISNLEENFGRIDERLKFLVEGQNEIKKALMQHMEK